MAFDPITGGEAVIEVALQIAEKLIEKKIIQIKRQNLDAIRDLQNDIHKEKEKGYTTDQAKVESLIAQLGVSRQAFMNEVLLNLAGGAPK